MTPVETIELDLLLEAIYRRYGHDFRNYVSASVRRRVGVFLAANGCGSIAELIPRILRDEEFFRELLRVFSITVTEMFRDPFMYACLRREVVPALRTWPHVKVWVAGCATGEEAYSVAILLHEEGLLPRSILYATDFNDEALETARKGRIARERLEAFGRNYRESGGARPFEGYFGGNGGSARLSERILEAIAFANHNLVTDAAFGEMHLILCRNVLIYFNRSLQDRALRLFDESLVRGGYLCIGGRETLRFTALEDGYDPVEERTRVYRKRSR